MYIPKRITVEWLNEQIKLTQAKGYRYPTEMEIYQQSFDALVISNSLKNGGQIRTLNEINAYLTKKYSKPELWTQEKYDAKLQSLIERLGGKITYSGVRSDIRRQNIDIVNEMNEYMETNHNPYFMNSDELYNAIKYAGEISKSARFSGGDTASAFYQALEEYLSDIESSHTRR